MAYRLLDTYPLPWHHKRLLAYANIRYPGSCEQEILAGSCNCVPARYGHQILSWVYFIVKTYRILSRLTDLVKNKWQCKINIKLNQCQSPFLSGVTDTRMKTCYEGVVLHIYTNLPSYESAHVPLILSPQATLSSVNLRRGCGLCPGRYPCPIQ